MSHLAGVVFILVGVLARPFYAVTAGGVDPLLHAAAVARGHASPTSGAAAPIPLRGRPGPPLSRAVEPSQVQGGCHCLEHRRVQRGGPRCRPLAHDLVAFAAPRDLVLCPALRGWLHADGVADHALGQVRGLRPVALVGRVPGEPQGESSLVPQDVAALRPARVQGRVNDCVRQVQPAGCVLTGCLVLDRPPADGDARRVRAGVRHLPVGGHLVLTARAVVGALLHNGHLWCRTPGAARAVHLLARTLRGLRLWATSRRCGLAPGEAVDRRRARGAGVDEVRSQGPSSTTLGFAGVESERKTRHVPEEERDRDPLLRLLQALRIVWVAHARCRLLQGEFHTSRLIHDGVGERGVREKAVVIKLVHANLQVAAVDEDSQCKFGNGCFRVGARPHKLEPQVNPAAVFDVDPAHLLINAKVRVQA
mmetsp:Transcript_99986/g.283192  ORF Transcript_99986/g.283192 Transcript_99986/m.283192 type:complete len:422 (+) Transcript_99986:379-1644(+)